MTTQLLKLADTPVDQFMQEDWHIRPRLFKNAIPDFEAVCDLETVFEMASDEDIESRLIQRDGQNWSLAHGPFEALPSLEQPNWTVLVQGIDHHLPEAYDLLQLFRFIPDARLDDIMLSLASHGGGVGPHYDSYDVFLLQMHGKRRWKIGPLTDNTLKKDAPLKILEHFTPTEEFLLEPGDMLYLPPNYGHDGVAEGVCTTLSIGFRALNKAEVVSGILHDFADRIQSDETLKKQLFSDPGRGLQSRPANLPDDLIEFALTLMREFKPGEDEITDSLGKMLTEPKPIVYYENNTEDMTIEEIRHTLIERGIALSMKTRMLVGKTSVFINGECVKPERKETYEFLSNLANSRQLEPKEVNSAFVNEEAAFFVIGFAKAGWIDTLF